MDNQELISKFREYEGLYGSLNNIVFSLCKHKLDNLRNEYVKEHSVAQVGDIVFGDGESILVSNIVINIEKDNITFTYQGEILRRNLSVKHGIFYNINNVDKIIKKN